MARRGKAPGMVVALATTLGSQSNALGMVVAIATTLGLQSNAPGTCRGPYRYLVVTSRANGNSTDHPVKTKDYTSEIHRHIERVATAHQIVERAEAAETLPRVGQLIPARARLLVEQIAD